MKGILTDILLVIILLIAAYLRFKGADVFMQDELSAISRLQFDSLGEVVSYGIRPDGHPALMQLWLFLYSGLVGHDAFALKLPSIIAGIVSVGLIFRIGRRVYGRKVGLFAAAMMASLQYFILYSQLIRPYSIGTMLCLWQMYLLIEATYHPERRMKWWWMMLAMALSAYTHYFSMMVSIIIGIGSFFLLDKGQRMAHLKAVAGAILLFLPHLPITLAQLDKGDLAQAGGWLGTPDRDFFIEFFAYFFQYHTLLIIAMVILAGMALLDLSQLDRRRRMIAVLFLLSGMLPYVIGHIYSIQIGPILQFSLLIFGMPMLLLFILGPLRRTHSWLTGVLLVVLLVMNVNGLYSTRDHYEVLSRQPTEQAVEQIRTFNEKGISPLLISTSNRGFLSAFQDRDELEFGFFLLTDSTSMVEFSDLLTGTDPETPVILLKCPLQYTSRIIDRYRQVDHWYGYGGDVVTADSPNQWVDVNDRIRSTLEKTKTIRVCPVDENERVPLPFVFNDGSEWGPSCNYDLEDLVDDKDVELHLIIRVDNEEEKGCIAVMELSRNGEQLAWRGADALTSGNGQAIYNSVHLRDMLPDHQEIEGVELTIYLWNRDKKARIMSGMVLMVDKSERSHYSLFEELPDR